MLGVQRLRELYPGKSDEQLARAYHKGRYPDMDFGEFMRRFQSASYEYERKASKGRRGGSNSGKSASGTSGGKQKGFDPMVQAMDLSGLGQDPKTGNYFYYKKDKNGEYLTNEKGERELDWGKRPSRLVLNEIREKLAREGLEGFDPTNPDNLTKPGSQTPAANQGNQTAANQQTALQPQNPQPQPLQSQGGVESAVAPVQAQPYQEYRPVDIGADNINDTLGAVSGSLRHFGDDARRGFKLLGEGVRGAIGWLGFSPGAGDEEMADYTINTARKW